MAEAEAGTTAGTATAEGQAAKAPEATGTTTTAPKSGEGKPGKVAEGKSKETAPQESTEDTFFDPKTLAPDLMPAYKNMQKAFSKKMEAISKDRSKIDAYDAFSRDPVGEIQKMASRLGYKLSRADIAEAQQQTQNWEPQTWNEVIDKIKSVTTQQVLNDLSPILSQVQEMRKSNIEKLLDDNCPDWRQYEDDMKANIQAHPSLVNDPVKLYRLSVPPEILESRAVQAALKKLEKKVQGANVSGVSTTTKHQSEGFGKVSTFQDAVEAAKRKLAEQGLHPPGQS